MKRQEKRRKKNKLMYQICSRCWCRLWWRRSSCCLQCSSVKRKPTLLTHIDYQFNRLNIRRSEIFKYCILNIWQNQINQGLDLWPAVHLLWETVAIFSICRQQIHSKWVREEFHTVGGRTGQEREHWLYKLQLLREQTTQLLSPH